MDTRPEPRRRNASESRARILAAAQKVFAEIGYSQAGIRDVAAIAGASTTLLLRYFGSKAGLFEAALTDAVQIGDLLEHEHAGFGAYLAAQLAQTDRILPPAMIALAMGDATAREITARVTALYAIQPLAAWLGPPRAEARALEIVILATGFVSYGRQLPIIPPQGEVDGHLVEWLGQAIQAIIDQSETART